MCWCGLLYFITQEKKLCILHFVGIFFMLTEKNSNLLRKVIVIWQPKPKDSSEKKKHLPCIFNVRVKIIFGIFHKAVIGSRQKLVLFPNQIYPSLSAWLWNIECLIKSRFSFHLWDKDWILKVYSSWTTSKTSMALTFVLGCLNYTDWFEVERNILKPNHLHS